jgi:hypothetical protein
VARDICPRCSSERIVPLPAGAWVDATANDFTADVTAPAPDPPNTRCENCRHEWWLAPRAPKIDPNEEGVPS